MLATLATLALAGSMATAPLAPADSIPGQGDDVPSAFGPFAFGAWIQPLFEHRSWSDDDSTVGFRLRRARLIVDGEGMEGQVRFRLMPDLGSTPQLRDAWVEVRHGLFRLRMGQQTVPFHLQRERSMARGHFGDRALASRRFELSGGRDIGVVGSTSAFAQHLRIDAGAFNGRGANRTDPSPSPLFAARTSLSLGAPATSGETDLERSPGPGVSLGLGAMGARESLLRPRPGFAADQAADWWGWTLDLHARYRGGSVAGGVFGHSITTPSGGESAVTTEVDGVGWFLGGGYVLPGRPVEVVLRHSEARWDRSRNGPAERETALGVTFFHRLHLLQTRIQLIRERGMLTGLSDESTRLTIEHQLLL